MLKCQKCQQVEAAAELCPLCQVRAKIYGIVIRQALTAGLRWREICAPVMRTNKIEPQDVEAELHRHINHYTTVISLEPKNAQAYVARGIVYNQLGQYEQALDDCNLGIELDHSNAKAYVARGLVYGEKEQYQAAIDEYNKAISLDPELGLAYTYRAGAYERLGQKEPAQQDIARTQGLTGKPFQTLRLPDIDGNVS